MAKTNILYAIILFLVFSCKAEAGEKKSEQKPAGVKTEVSEPEKEVEKETPFTKKLSLQNVEFSVSSGMKDGKNRLMVSTKGLPYEYDEYFEIENQIVIDAEVEDLNSDGSPELIVFAKDKEANKEVVHSFSVNNMKSMSDVYFRPTEQVEKVNVGYNGYDEFALVETYLAQRFPIFENGQKTGKIRQVTYTMEDGEATRLFEVKNVREYDE